MAEITPIQFLRGTAAAWTSANPTLAAGKPGFETDTGQLKIGDGSTAWNSLGYIGDGATGGPLSRTEPGTTLTVDDDDHNYIIEMSDGAGATITLPNTVAIGTYVTFIRGEGAGVTTFSPGGTSVFYTLGDEVTIDEERAWASWLKVSATEWYGAGGLGPLSGGGGGDFASLTGDPSDNAALASALGAKAATTDIVGVQDLYIPASAMWPRTSNGCASLTKSELATSLLNIQTLDFDQTTQEFAQFTIVLPRKYNNGTITAVFYWTAGSGSGDVQWGISGGAYSNDDALTVALGTAQTVSDTLIAANDLHITSATSAMTLAGTPADADFLGFQISRNPASDTLTGDAKLLGVSLRITTDAAKDA
jgi:hypothetical protein